LGHGLSQRIVGSPVGTATLSLRKCDPFLNPCTRRWGYSYTPSREKANKNEGEKGPETSFTDHIYSISDPMSVSWSLTAVSLMSCRDSSLVRGYPAYDIFHTVGFDLWHVDMPISF
jgi:hypothetical protein